MQELERVQQLGDHALIEQLAHSAKHDRQHTVRLLAELGEVQARGLFRDLGFSTMFDYATRKLRMSEAEAALRLRAAKLGREFPVALEMLGRSELNLTTLSLLTPLLTPDTLELLQEARFKSKQQVLALIAKHAAKPDVPDSIRRCPRPSAKASHAQVTTQPVAISPETEASLLPASAELLALDATSERPGSGPRAGCIGGAQAAPAANRSSADNAIDNTRAHSRPATHDVVVPLSPERHKITFTAGQRVRDMLEQAQDLRRHRFPAGDLEPLFERALELLIADEQRRRFARTDKPRTPPKPASASTVRPDAAPMADARAPTADARAPAPGALALTANAAKPHSRHIPNEVRRQVWIRDGGRCCFRGPDNERCCARSPLEFHHIVPFGRGGSPTAANIALLCRGHNTLCAERDYGRAFMQAAIAASSRTMSTPQR